MELENKMMNKAITDILYNLGYDGSEIQSFTDPEIETILNKLNLPVEG